MTDPIKKVDQRAVIGEIIAKCWQDDNFKKSFIENPKKYLVEAGLTIPDKIEVKVVEAGPKIMYSLLPRKVSMDFLQKMMKTLVNNGMSSGLKLPESGELRFIQNTSSLQYIIIPAKPLEGELCDADLELVAGGKRHHKDILSTSTNVLTGAEVVAELAVAAAVAGALVAVEATYTLTTAATNFEVAAEVAVVAAIVAT